MPPVRVGINGFGRIGRQITRAIKERHPNEIEVVAVNDLTDSETNAHLFKYDSNYGIYEGQVEVDGDDIMLDGERIQVFRQTDPGKIPWQEQSVEIVVESTGRFTDATKAAAHRHDTVKKVIISAPAKNEDLTVVLGVNEKQYDPGQHNVISNASCTTNCIATVIKVLQDRFGVERGLMSTIHSYTNDQRILDTVHEDLRRARAAALNIIPTTTGAAKAVTLVIPELKGKIHGLAYRVPTPTVSVCDFTGDLSRSVTADEVNAVFDEVSCSSLHGIVAFEKRELVSMDFKGNPNSAIVDGPLTMSIGDNMVKVVAWYDNEWGYSCRVADLAKFLVDRGL